MYMHWVGLALSYLNLTSSLNATDRVNLVPQLLSSRRYWIDEIQFELEKEIKYKQKSTPKFLKRQFIPKFGSNRSSQWLQLVWNVFCHPRIFYKNGSPQIFCTQRKRIMSRSGKNVNMIYVQVCDFNQFFINSPMKKIEIVYWSGMRRVVIYGIPHYTVSTPTSPTFAHQSNLCKSPPLCNFQSFVFVGSGGWVFGQGGVNQIGLNPSYPYFWLGPLSLWDEGNE